MIEWAGVETGAKIFVGLMERSAGSAKVVIGSPRRRTTWPSRISQSEEPNFRIFLSLRNSLMSVTDSSSLSAVGWKRTHPRESIFRCSKKH